ncbi:GNAT family N-acetyltransferase [Subtercola endophyticus]|uniref:hypothetical protein n=1 Tax=Subtercola endophyticus TaxID=2895559 RepID=UPI001E47EBAF|nr:hypothetical protein [Subtercola endophyticus]UFS59101.1 hypothetical protein LQ955_19335 [Subtercola endophyticus]
MTLTVERVTGEASLREFIELPLRLWPADLYVPLLESSIRSWFTGASPHPEPIELVVVRDSGDTGHASATAGGDGGGSNDASHASAPAGEDSGGGRVVARSTVHTDRRLDEKLGEKLLLFGATEFEDDAAAQALFAHLEARATEASASALFGPVSLLPNQSGGVITSGFDQRGFVDSAWNPVWVPSVYESAGFERWGEADTFIVRPGRLSDAPRRPSLDEWQAAGVRLEYGSKRRMRTLIPELLELLNASFAQLPYYTQITAAEMSAATDGLAFLLDERLLLLARDARSHRATAFVLVIPDITEFVQKVRGRLSLPRQLQLLATRARYRREAVLVIQGTDPPRQGQGILSLLTRQLQHNLRERGYSALRSTYIDRDNPASAAAFTRFGGRPLQAYTFYRKAVPRAADSPTTPNEEVTS